VCARIHLFTAGNARNVACCESTRKDFLAQQFAILCGAFFLCHQLQLRVMCVTFMYVLLCVFLYPLLLTGSEREWAKKCPNYCCRAKIRTTYGRKVASWKKSATRQATFRSATLFWRIFAQKLDSQMELSSYENCFVGVDFCES
jgi:hypothetical protein